MTDTTQEPTYDQDFATTVAEMEGAPAEQIDQPAQPAASAEATAETKPAEVTAEAQPKAEETKPAAAAASSAPAVDPQEFERLRQYERSNEGRIAAFQRTQDELRRELEKARREAQEAKESGRPQEESLPAEDSEEWKQFATDYPTIAAVMRKSAGKDLKGVIKAIVSEEVAPVKQAVDPLVTRSAQQAEADARALLNERHPGWVETVRSDEYRQWLAAQPASLQQMNRSPDPAEAARLLDIYKKDLGVAAPQPKPQPAPKVDRQKELEQAALPPSRQSREDQDGGSYDVMFAAQARKIESGMRAH